jgi:hypothetical protein
MAVNVYPAASASSVTPINGAFDYNFTTDSWAPAVTVDFTDTVPGGTYTISGATQGGFPVWKVQLLNNSSVVGEALTTYTTGTYATTNDSRYTVAVTSSGSFNKIKFIGLNGVQSVKFETTAPSGTFHITLRPGTRTLSARSIFQKIRDAGEGANYSLAGVTLPTGNPYAFWIYNAKLYVWYGTVAVGTLPTSATVNTQGIRAYNFATSSWESPLVTFNSSILGVNTWATLPTSTLNTSTIAQYVFKNGNVLLRTGRMLNTDGVNTTSYGTYSFFFNLSAGTVTSKNASVPNASALLNGSMAYVPSSDTWYATGYTNNGGYNNAVLKITNAGTISSLFTTTNEQSASWGYLWVEDSATPKISFITNDTNDSGAQWRSVQSNGTLDTMVTNSSPITSSNMGALTKNGDLRNVFVDADLFGITSSSFRFNYATTNPTPLYQNYTYPSSTTLSGTSDYPVFAQTSVITETPSPAAHFNDANGSGLTAYFQPISSTDYAVVFRATNGTLSTRANIVVCPISSTTQTLV